jgi:hypothetical protein
MVQVFALARPVPQLSDSVKGPVTEILLRVNWPRALSVTTSGALIEPTVVSTKSRLLGEVFSAENAVTSRMRLLP